jgi:hypothetical protein
MHGDRKQLPRPSIARAAVLLDNQIILDHFKPIDIACNFTRLVDGRVRSNEAAQLNSALVSFNTYLERFEKIIGPIEWACLALWPPSHKSPALRTPPSSGLRLAQRTRLPGYSGPRPPTRTPDRSNRAPALELKVLL